MQDSKPLKCFGKGETSSPTLAEVAQARLRLWASFAPRSRPFVWPIRNHSNWPNLHRLE